jgi:predicted RNA methylase
MEMLAFLETSNKAETPLVRYNACKAMARGYAKSLHTDEDRLESAKTFCTILIESYWSSLCVRNSTRIKIKRQPSYNLEIEEETANVARETGELITQFPVEDAGFLIGSIYTVMLPTKLRSSLGAYYTPPPLVSRLLDLAEKAGFNFATGSAIDPACGGGAFLAPLALRMLKSMPIASAEWSLKQISRRIKGIEIDPFAAWMTSVLLEAALMPLCVKAKKRLPNIVTVGDTLKLRKFGKFDLVIGNPPYGKVTLSDEDRKNFERSLYGHANLYGLFTDQALHLTKDDGIIALLTPTSFLGGQYFKKLRELLTQETTAIALEFISDRNGVFDDVLQETLLTAYTKTKSRAQVNLSVIVPQGLNSAKIEKIGKAKIPGSSEPWVLPRTPADAKFIASLTKKTTRLADLGFGVSTGQLVWNRHKSQLKSISTNKSLPLIWAESISSKGFCFRAEKRNHVPYIEVNSNQQHLITKKSCILLQRTTAKEQEKRLISAILPQNFIRTHKGVVIENHLNIISSLGSDKTSISIKTMNTLLGCSIVDRAFRCISGSVAVSAYELNALPLPSKEQLIKLEDYVKKGRGAKAIDKLVKSFYGELGQ